MTSWSLEHPAGAGVRTVMSRRTTGDATKARKNYRIAKLGSAQFVVVLSGLGALFVVAAIACYPTLHDEYVKAVAIEPFEPLFGFQSGPVVLHWPGQEGEIAWGIASVAEDGVFARAGVRAGDIPFGWHSGVTALYGALHDASSGRATSFEVFNAGDAHLGADALREIRLAAIRR